MPNPQTPLILSLSGDGKATTFGDVTRPGLKNCQYCHFDRREKSLTTFNSKDFSLLTLLEMTKFKLSMPPLIAESWNTGRIEAVPRHTEISDRLALKICRALSIPDPQ
jgi:hypothetical protein